MKPCDWCGPASPVDDRQRFCSRKCRQAAFRVRRRAQQLDAGREYSGDVSSGPGLLAGARFAYADPPYVGLAHYYRDQASYGGEVDHPALIERLKASGYAGWALSASSASLRYLLPLCPSSARVCAWVKPIGVSGQTAGLHSTWEPLIVVGGRNCRPGVRDWVSAQPARQGGSDLIGRKPLGFCAFLFDALGMVPGDQLDDLFPGSGIVGRAWAELSATARAVDDAGGPSLGAGSRRRLSSLLEQRQLSLSADVAAAGATR